MIPFYVQGSRTPVQVAYASAGAATNTPGSGVAYPSGITGGDFLLLHACDVQSVSSSGAGTPSGWSVIDGPQFVLNGGLYDVSTLMGKLATGSESGSLAVSGCNGARMYRLSRASGYESAGGAATLASATAMNCVDVTSTVALGLAVQAFFCYIGGAATTIGNVSGESGGDYTEAVAEATDTGTGWLLSLQVATLAAAGSITGGSATLSGSRASRIRHGCVVKA